MASWPRGSTASPDENVLPGGFLFSRMKAHAITRATKATPANLIKRQSQPLHCVFLRYARPSLASAPSPSRCAVPSKSITSADSSSSCIAACLGYASLLILRIVSASLLKTLYTVQYLVGSTAGEGPEVVYCINQYSLRRAYSDPGGC